MTPLITSLASCPGCTPVKLVRNHQGTSNSGFVSAAGLVIGAPKQFDRLSEYKTLLGLSALWLTGSSAVSSGQTPFWRSASTSVPTAPASSEVTGSQPVASKPGSEIWPPAWVAPASVVQLVVAALLCTCQPDRPRVLVPPAPSVAAATVTAPAVFAACAEDARPADAATAAPGMPSRARLATQAVIPAIRSLTGMGASMSARSGSSRITFRMKIYRERLNYSD